MSEERSGTQYYMTSEFHDILVAEKLSSKVPITGGISKDSQHSRNLLDGTKSLLNYTDEYDVLSEFNKPENSNHEVNQMAQRLQSHGGGLKPIDYKVIAAALQPPDLEKGVWDRVILTNNPDVKKLVTGLGGKAMGVEELGKQLKDNNLVGKEDLDLLKRSTKEQSKKPRAGFDVTGAIKDEKQLRMQMRRQRVRVEDKSKGRKVSRDNLGGMD